MITISVCMIVKNEEDVLARCLECAKEFADEIIIVDTGSTDNTKAIAGSFTDKIYDFEWIDDFAAARNYSFSKATMKYSMWLDADDIILPEDIGLIKALKSELSENVDAVKMKYNTSFDDKGKPTFSFYRERLVRTECNFKWTGAVHETIAISGNIIFSPAAISHKKLMVKDPMRNLRIFKKQIKDGKKLSPRDRFYYARELTYHGHDSAAIPILDSVIEDDSAWLENRIEAAKLISECHKRAGHTKNAIASLLSTLELDVPRAEICCALGDIFTESKAYTRAIFWYETALKCKRNDSSGGFVLPDMYDYHPHLQLCVCYYRIGNISASRRHNNKAARIKPDSMAVKFNRDFFKKMDKKD